MSPDDAWGFKSIECGNFGLPLLQRAFDRAGPPVVVFHGIGASSVAQANSDPTADSLRTVELTVQLLKSIEKLAPTTRVIYPSSAAVYGTKAIGPISEDSSISPISVYGENKFYAENICREFSRHNGLNIIIARFFSVYGAPQRKLLLWDLGMRLLHGERNLLLGGTGEETRDFIHVSDAAAIVGALAVALEPPTLLNVGTGQATSIRTLARTFAAALDVRAEINFDNLSRAGDPPHQQADISRLSEIGITSWLTLEQGLREYAAWLRATAGKE